MAARRVSITISAEDRFSSVLNKYNAALGTADQTTRRVEQSSRSMFQRFRNGIGSIGGLATAFAGLAAVKIGLDMRSLGEDVARTRRNFTALAEDLGGYTTVIEAMRRATRGAVSDFDLMSGANLLMSTHAAETADEMERLSRIAVTLGQTFGRDANTALQDFSLLLSNQSIMRLDNFGISAANVRRRIAELQEEMVGLDRSDAFRMATIEEGEAAMERLGVAAEQQVTAVDRLEARFQNLWEGLAEGAAGAVEGVASGIEGLVESITTQFGSRETAAEAAAALEDMLVYITSNAEPIAQEQGEFIGTTLANAVVEAMGNVDMARALTLATDPNFIPTGAGSLGPGQAGPVSRQTVASAALRAAGIDDTQENVRDLIAAMNSLEEALYAQDYFAREAEARASVEAAYAEQERQRAIDAQAQHLQSASQLLAGGMRRPTIHGAEVLAEQWQPLNEVIATEGMQTQFSQMGPGIARAVGHSIDNFLSNLMGAPDRIYGAGAEARSAQAQAQANITLQTMRGAEAGAQGMFQGAGGRQRTFFTQEESDRMNQLLEQAQTRLEHLQDQFSEGLIGEDTVNQAADMVANMEAMAEAADRGAESFSTLQGILGTEGGGVFGEVGDVFLEAAQGAGVAADQVSALGTAMDMATGRTNELEQSLGAISSLFADAFSAGAIDESGFVAGVENITNVLQELRLAGFDQAEMSTMLDNLAAVTGAAGLGGGFDVNTFITGMERQGTGNLGGDQYDQAMGGPAMGEGTDPFTQVEEGLGRIQEAADTTSESLSNMNEPMNLVAADAATASQHFASTDTATASILSTLSQTEEPMTTMTELVPQIDEGMAGLAGKARGYGEALQGPKQELTVIESLIQRISSTHRVTLYVDVTGPGADILNGGGGPRENGGNVPGVDDRTDNVENAPPPRPPVTDGAP